MQLFVFVRETAKQAVTIKTMKMSTTSPMTRPLLSIFGGKSFFLSFF